MTGRKVSRKHKWIVREATKYHRKGYELEDALAKLGITLEEYLDAFLTVEGLSLEEFKSKAEKAIENALERWAKEKGVTKREVIREIRLNEGIADELCEICGADEGEDHQDWCVLSKKGIDYIRSCVKKGMPKDEIINKVSAKFRTSRKKGVGKYERLNERNSFTLG